MPKQASREFRYAADQVFAAVQVALATIEGMSIKDVDAATRSLHAGTGVSLASWGERVGVQVTEVGPERAAVAIEVRLKAQAFGWGKQQRQIDRIFTAVDGALALAASPRTEQ